MSEGTDTGKLWIWIALVLSFPLFWAIGLGPIALLPMFAGIFGIFVFTGSAEQPTKVCCPALEVPYQAYIYEDRRLRAVDQYGRTIEARQIRVRPHNGNDA